MKRVLTLPLAVAPIVAMHAQPWSVGGTWTVTTIVSGSQSEQTCAFTQKETELTGTCKSERGSFSIAGKADGKTVGWQYETEYEGQKLTPVYSGTIESVDKIVGTVDVQGMGLSGDFTATRAK